MKIFAFICTRSKDLSPTTQRLVSYLSRCNIQTKLLVNQKSIFSGYAKALKDLEADPEDIVIMCHDDIDILLSRDNFTSILINSLADSTTGFIGPAGTTTLTHTSVWWDQEQWQLGKHRGMVFHGKGLTLNPEITFYGQCGPVAVLDGVFLAATVKTLKEVGLEKPDYLEGGWDFYDIHYTLVAHRKGLVNKAVPLLLTHNSPGSIDRESWNTNRICFFNKHKNEFPIL